MYLIFTPLFYINGDPHIGHLYTLYIAKMFGRYLSASGKSYITLTGTDEHGEKVYKSYLNYILKHHKKNFSLDDYRHMRRTSFKEAFGSLDSCVIYNTHSNMHITYVKHIFRLLKNNGIIYEGYYSGHYSLREEKYIDIKEYEQLSEEERQAFIIKKEEKGYYLKLEQNIKDQIINKIDENVISSEYIEYAKQLVKDANDVFVSRLGSNSDKKIEHSIYCEEEDVYLYVWFDAILYYCAILRVYNHELFKPVIVIGKDIQMFHVSILLHLSYHLFGYFPFKLVIHGMIRVSNKKISKSSDNASTFKLLEDKYSDLLYSYLLSKDFVNDIEVSEEGIIQYFNFIRNNVRNCYKRYFSLLASYKASVSDWYVLANKLLEHEDHQKLVNLFYRVYNLDEKLNGSEIYAALLEAASYSNKMITDQEFWNHSSDKEVAFFIIGNYIRFMVLLESILCVPGIENIYQALQENITAAFSMATKMVEINMSDLKILDLDVFASKKYRKQSQEKMVQSKNS